MKTKNNPSKRQENIINYLNSHDEVTTEEIKKEFNIAKSTLSEDIKYLRSKGYPIKTRYGYISLEKNEENPPIQYYEKLTPEIIRKWIILFIANTFTNPITSYEDTIPQEELYTFCHNIYSILSPKKEAMSAQVFHKDLRELIRENYITYTTLTEQSLYENKYMKNSERELYATDKSPKMILVNEKAAPIIYDYLENETGAYVFADLKKILKQAFPKQIKVSRYSEKNGYHNIVPDNLESLLIYFEYNFYDFDFDIKCKVTFKNFKFHAFIYIERLNKIYILGKAYIENSIGNNAQEKETCIIPVESITSIQKNKCTQREFYGYTDDLLKELNLSPKKEEPASLTEAEKIKLKRRYEESLNLKP